MTCPEKRTRNPVGTRTWRISRRARRTSGPRTADTGGRGPWLPSEPVEPHRLSSYLAEVRERRVAETEKTRRLVEERLRVEHDRLSETSRQAAERERVGEKVKESSDSLARKAAEPRLRRHQCLGQLKLQSRLVPRPPEVLVAALLPPAG